MVQLSDLGSSSDCHDPLFVFEGRVQNDQIEQAHVVSSSDSSLREVPRELHGMLSNDISILKPHIGRVFRSHEEAYNNYNAYAFKAGFGIRINSVGSSRSDKSKKIRREFLCHKAGFKTVPKDGKQPMFSRRIKRTGCMSKMAILMREDSSWVVSVFLDDHNHAMIDRSMVMEIYSHNTYHRSETIKRMVAVLFEIGIRPMAIRKFLNFDIGPFDAPVTTQQVCDITRHLRNTNIGCECAEVMKCFYERKANDPDFFFNFDLDDDGTLRHLFWADKRSKMDYGKFHDVVVFDVTYRTNRFSLPFAPFTGVNHHFQSTLFAAGFLRNEQTASFVWLFKQFLQCMDNVHPLAIITDQDHAICSAIEEVFPTTKHRYCSWHMKNHIQDHLRSYFSMTEKDFVKDYNKWFRSKSPELETTAHDKLNDDYEIHKSSWFQRMYRRKEHWVPCYLKSYFWAGMTTTQRSESINAFFDNYVNAHTPISLFVKQYDKAVSDRRSKERSEDFKSINSSPQMFLGHEFEKQAGAHYTSAMYQRFLDEFKRAFNLTNALKSSSQLIEVYSVKERSNDSGSRSDIAVDYIYEVVFNQERELCIECECGLFVFEGIPCKHMLHIMHFKQLPKIPVCYLLPRWSTLMRQPEYNTKNGQRGGTNPLFYNLIKKKLDLVLNAAAQDASLHARFESFLTDLHNEIQPANGIENPVGSQSLDGDELNRGSMPIDPSLFYGIHDPQNVVTKGRPKNVTRVRSGKEDSITNTKRKYSCRTCQGSGHNSQSCPQLKKAHS